MLSALVVNCSRNGLGVIRSLAKAGIEVYAVDHTRFSPGIHSKFVKKSFVVIDPKQDPSAFVDGLIEIGKETATVEPVVLIPVNDAQVFACKEEWHRLSKFFIAGFETDTDILADCLEKTRMFNIAEQAGVPYPKTWINVDVSEVDQDAYPVVIKPRDKSQPGRHGVFPFRIHFCNCPDELKLYINELREIEVDYVVQKYIVGGDDELYTAGIYTFQGKVLGAATGRKLRQFPPELGECSYGELVNCPKIIDYSARFVKATGYTGIAQVEFKHNNGEYFLIEINPRSWSWNSLIFLAGVNLPQLAVEKTSTGQCEPQKQSNFAGKWVYFPADIIYNVLLNRNISLFEALKSAWSAECKAFWDINDLKPSLFLLPYVISVAAKRYFKRKQRGNNGVTH